MLIWTQFARLQTLLETILLNGILKLRLKLLKKYYLVKQKIVEW